MTGTEAAILQLEVRFLDGYFLKWRRFVRQSRDHSLRYGALASSLPLLAILLSLSGGQLGKFIVVNVTE